MNRQEYGMIVVPEDELIRMRLRAEAAEKALALVPLDEWEELANDDVLDLIDAGTMLAFLASARAVLAAVRPWAESE